MTNQLRRRGPRSRPQQQPTPVSDWQVDLLRKALDARGLTTMADRQQVIEAAAGRPVASLRDLTQDKALFVLSKLGEAPAEKVSGNSAWDDREEDTWIDRLWWVGAEALTSQGSGRPPRRSVLEVHWCRAARPARLAESA